MPDITSTPAEQVVIRFTVREDDHEYSDALYFTPAEYAALTEADIEAMQRQRFDNWLAIVTAPPREPTDEEKAAQLAALVEQQAAIAAQIAAMQGEV